MRTDTPATRSLTAALLSVVLAALPAAAPAGQAGPAPLWLHVQIENAGGEDGGLHLPVAAVGALLQMAQAQGTVIENGQLRLGDEYLPPLRAMRTVWHQLQAAGEGEPVSAEYEGALVRVARSGGRLELHVEDGDRAARGEVPAAVAEALLSGAEDALDIAAGLAALSALPGEVVQITESTIRRVRIWIDDTPGQ